MYFKITRHEVPKKIKWIEVYKIYLTKINFFRNMKVNFERQTSNYLESTTG